MLMLMWFLWLNKKVKVYFFDLLPNQGCQRCFNRPSFSGMTALTLCSDL